GDPLSLTISGPNGYPLPRYARFTDHQDGTGVLHLAPGLGDLGTIVLTVTATAQTGEPGSAATLSTSTAMVVTVGSPNEPPQLVYIGDEVAVVGQPLQFTVVAHDLDQDTLTFTAPDRPAAATLTAGSVYGTAAFTWTPTT